MTNFDVIELPLPDAPARRRISADLDANLLVEAGAGSGKTTELVSRMVALVEEGVATVEHIAAVTFTRKAASELRERFQTRLEERLGKEKAEASEGPAVDRLAEALDDIDRAFIGTIHAFCARLLRERPLEVGLDPDFEELPAEERLVLRRRFWRSYLERLTRDSDPTLEELARTGLRPLDLYGLFDRLVENPDVEFPAEGADPPSMAELGPLRAELETIVDHAWELMPERPPEKDWDSLQKKLRTLHFERDVTGWEEPADLCEALARVCKPGPRGHSITQNRWKNAGMAKNLRDRVNAFAVGETQARRVLDRWHAHRYALAIALTGRAADEFAQHRLRIGRLDFQDLLVLAAGLLRSNARARKQLGERYRRILVDEFQDTDPLQAEIVLLLAAETPAERPGDSGENASGSEQEALEADWRSVVPRPGALFVVGDPKQSIYRFRRADIQLYALVKERFSRFGDVLELTTNFRSRPAIGDLVNEVFDAEDFFPRAATAEQAAFEPLNTRPPKAPVPAEGVFSYGVFPDRKNQASAALDDAGRLAGWIRGRVESGEREPGDFLILARNKARLAVYARALEAHSLPIQVTGAGVGIEEEIEELRVVLRCMIDPTNPVKVVAALVGLFFGLDYERLVAHRLEGGGFDAMDPGKRGQPDVLGALARLSQWWNLARSQPADIFVSTLASELGLLPYAAAGELGSLRAGALVYALDSVRGAALAGDASLPGALDALESALTLPEAEAPLEPGRPDVVRLMNLHQAKGLEARVVVLADPAGAGRFQPEMHVVRGEDGSAQGYMRVTEGREGFRSSVVLAAPPRWEEKQQAEERFDAAEGVRLLYVAVTRAKEELLVARWVDGGDASPWRALHPWLDQRAVQLDLGHVEPPPRAGVQMTAEQAHQASADAARSLVELGMPSFRHTPVTTLAKGEPSTTEAQGAPQPTPARGARGFSWGSAVHGALAAAAATPDAEALRATCRDLLVEHDRPLDDHGEPVELAELLELVAAVRTSELWTRAGLAERVLAEIPFALPLSAAARPESAAPDPPPPEDNGPQMELFGDSRQGAPSQAAAETRADPRTVLEGVIDLAFLEDGGWVIADYKTDVGTDPDFPSREAAYRRQVDLYADAWARLTGDPVKERVLFFTAQDRVERW